MRLIYRGIGRCNEHVRLYGCDFLKREKPWWCQGEIMGSA